MLLVLDNLEQLLPAAGLIEELLADSAGLRVLATSRSALHVYGEQEFPVPPLALPAVERAARPGRVGRRLPPSPCSSTARGR